MCEEGDPFEFNHFFDTIQPKRGMATKKEIDELVTFLGGFEKWPVLFEDCRREVVKYLDFQSRLNLGICSKDDHETVEKTKICVESIEIKDTQKLHYFINNKEGFVSFFVRFWHSSGPIFHMLVLHDNVTVSIQFPTGNPFEWVFSQLEQDTRVQWLHRIHTQRPVVTEFIWKSCDYYEEAVKFAEKWMRKSNFEMEGITIQMAKYPFSTSQIKSLPNCRNVTICADDADSFGWWLKKCPERIDDLQLVVYSESFTLPSDFLNAPQIMQALDVCFWCRAAFSDEQLLKLNAKSINIESADVTDKGINKFIRNWVNEKGVNGFKNLELRDSTIRDPEGIIAGLDYVEWDQAFENEHWDFIEDFERFCKLDQCYQIKSKVHPFESLTLSIYDNWVYIFATGKRAERNGEAYTYYRMPYHED
ncbi:hypothetical protein CAEBREN_20540 [Caenorhabditis brenneri]|uniref:Sdz-33 F-box domain-containing protein n=1 Tax=Caenorhabditis brenneri TaxID=135651 RepID=G0N068_CAEBE|nr:hypothetical protein CAEBREN_20540 [Caenorhabditis brenneri]